MNGPMKLLRWPVDVKKGSGWRSVSFRFSPNDVLKLVYKGTLLNDMWVFKQKEYGEYIHYTCFFGPVVI